MPKTLESSKRRGIDKELATLPRTLSSSSTVGVRKRITARIPEPMQKTLEEAANLLGSTVNQFVVQIAYQEAQKLLERESILRLSREDAQQVFNLLRNPPAPNKKLTDAVKLFRASGVCIK